MSAHAVARVERSTLTGRDYIETADWSVPEIDEALAVAGELKAAFKEGRPHRLLPDKTLFMLFLDKSTRTRNAFESGMTQLGGHAIYLDAEKTQVAHGESPKDMGIILSGYGHGLAIRHDLAPYEGNAWMREIAKWADIPLINLQCDIDHPTQTLADLMTLREKLGEELRGLKVAVTWAYAPSYAKPMSVPAGAADAAAAVRNRRRPRAPAGVRADAGDAREARRRRARRAAARSGSSTRWRRRSRVPTSSTRSRGAACDAFATRPRASRTRGSIESWICDARAMALAKPGRALHALPPRRPRQRGDRRGHRRPAVGRLSRGGEPHAHRQGVDGADHGRLQRLRPSRRATSGDCPWTRPGGPRPGTVPGRGRMSRCATVVSGRLRLVPRMPRNALPAYGCFHITARGVDRCLIYRDVDDYRLFNVLFRRLAREAGLKVIVYCLMPNHYHAIIEGPMQAISRVPPPQRHPRAVVQRPAHPDRAPLPGALSREGRRDGRALRGRVRLRAPEPGPRRPLRPRIRLAVERAGASPTASSSADGASFMRRPALRSRPCPGTVPGHGWSDYAATAAATGATVGPRGRRRCRRVLEGADGGDAAGRLHEAAGGLDLRAHRAGGEAELAHRGRRRVPDGCGSRRPSRTSPQGRR